MIMLDVRNAVAAILDRYTLAQVVEVTIRAARRDRLPIPFATVKIFANEASPSQASGLFS